MFGEILVSLVALVVLFLVAVVIVVVVCFVILSTCLSNMADRHFVFVYLMLLACMKNLCLPC